MPYFLGKRIRNSNMIDVLLEDDDTTAPAARAKASLRHTDYSNVGSRSRNARSVGSRTTFMQLSTPLLPSAETSSMSHTTTNILDAQIDQEDARMELDGAGLQHNGLYDDLEEAYLRDLDGQPLFEKRRKRTAGVSVNLWSNIAADREHRTTRCANGRRRLMCGWRK